MVSDDYFDDDGFIHYVPTTVDADYLLLIVTTLFCILSNAILPCLVTLGSRYEKRKLARGASELKDESVDATCEQPQPAKDRKHGALEIHDNSRKSEGDQNTDSHGGGSSSKGALDTDAPGHTTWRSLLDQIMTPPYPDEGGSVIGGSAFVGDRRPLVPDAAGVEETRSALTHATGVSVASSNFWSTNVLDAGLGARNRTRAVRRQRRVLGDKELRRQDQKAELEADRKEYGLVITDADGVDHHGMSASQLVGIEAKHGSSEVASKVSSHHGFSRPSGMRGRRGKRDGSAISGQSRKRGEGSALSGMSRRRGHSPEPSILSGLDDHVISPNDAADADDPGYYILPKQIDDADQDIDLCCGKRAWWKPSILLEAFNRLVRLAEYDHEMKRIVKLCIPFSITALLGGIVESANVALVSQFIGTSAVAAFTLVHLVLGLTGEFLGGILASEATLCSHAVGAGNYNLAGQYVQICTLLFTLLMIPNIILWLFFVDDVIVLFGFTEELGQLGLEYARVYVFHQWLIGLQIAYSGLLNVIGYENFATTMVALEGLAGVVGTALLVTFREATLQEVALVHLSVGAVFFLLTVCISVCHGRMGRYLSGMVGSAAFLNKSAVRCVVGTALPIAFGCLFEYSEWEILTIFTAHLGTAEVAAWGILGSLWETFETLSKGIGDGGEVRCAYHLGNGNPGLARTSANKTILLSICASVFFTSLLFMIGENLVLIFTSDPTLQHMIAELLPLLGVGNIFLTAGCVAWALVGAQGRYRLATLIALISSWGITIPLAAAMTYGFHLNLQGITSAVVIGYSVTCTALFYVILRSDWERISKHVVEINEDSDDESSVESADEMTEVAAPPNTGMVH